MTKDKKARPQKKIFSVIVVALLTLLMTLSFMITGMPAFAEGGEGTGDTPPTETVAPTEPAPTESFAPSEEPLPTEMPTPDISDMETTKVNGLECVDGEIIVKFKNNVSDANMVSALATVDSDVQQELPLDNLVVTDVPEGETVESFIDTMEDQPGVEYAQPNYIYHIDKSVNDPYASPDFQWHLRTIGAFDAWDITMGSSSIKVAVVDTGIDLDHPDLIGKISTQYNAIHPGYSAQDDAGHGTHVAGIIAATANNGQGGAGVAPGVKLMAVKVLDSNGNGTTATCAAGVIYAADHGADVINMSYGGYGQDLAESNAVNYAVNSGAVCVAAAGNYSTTDYSTPSDIESCISVMATDEDDNRASFSDYGPNKDISAPGDGVYSTYNPSIYPYVYYLDESGTSMASPVVAGVAALVLSVNPNLTVAQVKDILYSTAVDLGADGKDDYYGYGRVNAAGAVYKAAGRSLFSGGTGTSSDPYRISTPEQLNAVRYCPDASFKMTGNIDMLAATSYGGKYYYSGFGWSPIAVLNGTFDGQGYTINGLNVTNADSNYAGLFANINTGAVIKNLNMTNSYILGQEYVGGIAGQNNGTITYCNSNADIISDYEHVGGITGDNEGTVSYCNNSGTITGRSDRVGGIAGECVDGSIIYSANSADISGYSSVGGVVGHLEGSISWCSNSGQIESDASAVGGIAGYLYDFNTKVGRIQACYNTGDIISNYSSEYDEAGGIAGYCIAGAISDCFNMGTIYADNKEAGGIAGYCGSTIYRCYNLGNKGILGYGFAGSAPVNCFYLEPGYVNSFGTSKTEAQLRTKAAFSGFDFTYVWQIDEGKRFPTLRLTPFASVTAVTLPDTLKLKLGQSAVLTPVFTPVNPVIKDVTWVSSNPSVATVSNGTVRLVSDGSAAITVTTKDGALTDTCQITIMHEYTISVSSSNTAFGTVSGGRTYDEDAAVTLTATPRDGYRFIHWTENGSEVSTSAVYTFTAVQNKTLTAEFAQIGTPTITSALPSDYNAAQLAWSAVEGAAGYEVWRSSSAGGTYTNIYTQSGTSYSNTGLSAGTTYYYKIRAYCNAGAARTYGGYSGNVSVRPVPLASSSCTASQVDYDSIYVSWSAVANASGYLVYRSEAENGYYTLITTISGTRTNYTNNGVGTYTRYYYKVRAYRSSSSIYGDFSPAANAVTNLLSMENVSAVTYNPTSIKISWNAVPGKSGYEIYRSLTGAENSYEYYKTTTSTYYNDTGLTIDYPYYYKVWAYRTVNGVKKYNDFSSVKFDTARVFKVTGQKAAMYSVTSNKISWSSVTGASGYQVYRCDAGGHVTLELFPTTTSTYFYDKTITPGQTYYYKVRAFKKIGVENKYGDYSDLAVCESKVSGITAAMYTVNSNKISWNAVNSRTGYDVYWSDAENGTYTKIPSASVITNTYFYHKGFTTDKTYYYKVLAYQIVNGVRKESGFSDAVSVTNQIGGAKAVSYTASSNKITWNAVTGRTGYEVYWSDAEGGVYTKIITASPITNTYYCHSGLETDKTYYYKVLAYQTINGEKVCCGYSEIVHAAPSIVALTGAKAARYNSTKIKLTWNSVSDVTGFEIQRCTTGNATDFVKIMTTTNTLAYYYDGGLSTGTKYYYRIRAYRLSGDVMHYGEWSATVNATP